MEYQPSQSGERLTVLSTSNSLKCPHNGNAAGDVSASGKHTINGLVPKSPEERERQLHHRTLSVETSHQNKSSCSVGHTLSSISSLIIVGLEKAFFRIGHFVGRYPILTIVVCLTMCALTGLGMKTFTGDTDDDTVWVPRGARLLDEKKWVEATFPDETRFVSFLIENKANVLTPSVIKAMLTYYEESFTVSANGKMFSQICVRTGTFCSVACLLELWMYNSTVINGLTDTDIINAINNTETTPLSGVEVETLLGGQLVRDSSGAIISAEATQMTWVSTKEDESAAAAFEKAMINIGLAGQSDVEHTFVYASRSFEDEGYSAINSDVNLLLTGFIIVFVYILFALGKFNLMEQKIYLSLCGMACVGLSVLVAYGIGTALSIIYSPIQSIMPFLLLGIGVDDMFVIVESWKNLTPEDRDLPVPDKIALCLGRAGVSITVTSVTDVVAFGIGASTVIPALSSFCIYATIGIFALFFLVSTLFVAVLTLDERRRKARRDACIVCYRHSENYQPNKWSTGQSFLQNIFTNYYGPFIIKKPVKVVIILLSLGMVAIGMWRFTQMREDFDVVNYIPSDSYAYKYSRTKEHYFNRQGIATRIYCADFDYSVYDSNLDQMHTEMENSYYIQQGTINAWFNAFHDHVNTTGVTISSAADYYHELYQYINSPSGNRYSSFIKWNDTQEPVSIVASYIKATHARQENSRDNIRSMDGLRSIIDSAGFPKFHGDDLPEYKCFSYAREYMSLETNKVLKDELYRNLALAAVAVLLVTIVLVSNLRTSVMVFICVFFTVVDVGGVLELWGTTIDTASSVLLTLAVGLAVDYSVHIGHTFMTVEGTRHGRTVLTLQHIGPAVLNGGLSTFLAFVLLSNSASYGFLLFFRVFMSVVLFGMFHGLCFLPVLLSLFGPPSYKELQEEKNEDKSPPIANHSYSNPHNGINWKEPASSVEMREEGHEGPYSEVDCKAEEQLGTRENENHFENLPKDSKNGVEPVISHDDCSDESHEKKHISVISINGSVSGIGKSDDGNVGDAYQSAANPTDTLDYNSQSTTKF